MARKVSEFDRGPPRSVRAWSEAGAGDAADEGPADDLASFRSVVLGVGYMMFPSLGFWGGVYLLVQASL